jgi:hypothetical protein
MWEWCDKLKLGTSSSAFVKRDIRSLPQTEAEFEVDFFLDPEFSTKRQEAWAGAVIEREHGSVVALEDVQLPPPTVNCVANLLAHAMLRPQYGDRQRPRIIYLRDRPQWQELLPHLWQLGIEVILSKDLPRFDEAVIEWMQKTKKPPSAEKIKTMLRNPFPERDRTWFTDSMELTEWSDAMFKRAFPSRKNPDPPYNPDTSVAITLTAEELDSILTKTEIARTKKLRPRLEAMAAEGKPIELDVTEWSSVLLPLCGARVKEESVRRHLHEIARKIAGQLAQELGIDPPPCEEHFDD